MRVYTPIVPAKTDFRKVSQAKASQCACNKVRKAARAITRVYDEALRPSGLRVTQFGILGITSALQPVTVTRLADETVTDRTTLTRNLRLLEKLGFIKINEGKDRRERVVVLTSEGRGALKRAYPMWQQAQAYVVEELGRDQWEHLSEGLSAITTLVQEK
ncbi:MAG TPA: MarR family winged helix-turn-helix transcriptional regulator [Blastocatellia bacterium]